MDAPVGSQTVDAGRWKKKRRGIPEIRTFNGFPILDLVVDKAWLLMSMVWRSMQYSLHPRPRADHHAPVSTGHQQSSSS